MNKNMSLAHKMIIGLEIDLDLQAIKIDSIASPGPLADDQTDHDPNQWIAKLFASSAGERAT
jgi:hypothetical protein